MRLLLYLLCLSAASCVQSAYAGDFLVGVAVPGADAGSTAKIAITPNAQFMVSATSTVNYRVCNSTTCTATSTDAPIQGGAQVDLCAPSGYPEASFYMADGGTARVSVYLVKPSTVCQTQ